MADPQYVTSVRAVLPLVVTGGTSPVISLIGGGTGILTVPYGGTGVATITGLVQGNGTGVFTAVTNSSTVGQVLRVTAASTYAWGALDLADGDAVTGILPIANGGTGSATQTFVTSVGGSGNIASSGGLTPNITFTGTLPIANGGTGSATQNFVDISTAQTGLAGAKSWTALHTRGTGTQTDATSYGQALALRSAWNMTAVGTGANGSANEFGFVLQNTIPESTPASAASYEKAGLLVQTYTADPSGGGIDRDAVGADLRGFIAATNATGRAWGINAWAGIVTGGDGLLTGIEIDIDSQAAKNQTAVNQANSKYGMTIVPIGTGDVTAGIYMLSGAGVSSGFTYGLYLSSILSEALHVEASGGTQFKIGSTGNMTWYDTAGANGVHYHELAQVR